MLSEKASSLGLSKRASGGQTAAEDEEDDRVRRAEQDLIDRIINGEEVGHCAFRLVYL